MYSDATSSGETSEIPFIEQALSLLKVCTRLGKVWRWQQCVTNFSPQIQKAQLGPPKPPAGPAHARTPLQLCESSEQSENDNGLIVFFQGTHHQTALGRDIPIADAHTTYMCSRGRSAYFSQLAKCAMSHARVR